VLDLELLFLPVGLSYITTPGIFLCLLMVFQVPGRIIIIIIIIVVVVIVTHGFCDSFQLKEYQ